MDAKPSRTCGACSQCCKVMGIDELAKPAGVWCSHRVVGVGCDIHGRHPASCRAFACQWLVEPAMPPRLRPDRTKVVLVAEGEPARLVAYCDPANPLAWRREPVYSLLKAQARAAVRSVIARAGARLWLIAADEDIDLGEVDPRSAFRVERDGGGRLRVTPIPPAL
jgi:hypothetical protein